jgi:DNA-binding response OmpR family regulator
LPIIVLSGRDGDTDRVRALDGGADDFVLKPASYEELRARIAAVLRCTRVGPTRVGELLVDAATWKVVVGERDVRLAKKEFSLLLLLASDPTRRGIVTRPHQLDGAFAVGKPGAGVEAFKTL